MRFPQFTGNYLSNRFGVLVNLRTEKYDPLKSKNHFPCIELENIEQESCILNSLFDSIEQKSIKTKFKKGDILFGKLRPYLKKYVQVDFDGVCSTEIWAMNSNSLLNRYVFYYIQTTRFLAIANTSSGTKMPRAEWSLVSASIIKYPNSIEEMQAVSKFLSLIDRRIETQSKIIEDLEYQIKWIRYKIFRNLNNVPNHRLSEFLSEYSEKNANNAFIPIAVGKHGIRKRNEIYNKELSSDYSKNKVIHQNTLVIGMGSTQIDIGVLTNKETFCVSPAYTTYKINNINASYLNELLIFLNPLLSKKYMIISARQGKSVNKKELLTYKIFVHSNKIQIKIEKLFKLLCFRIQKEKDILELYKKQKAYLLKNMFI